MRLYIGSFTRPAPYIESAKGRGIEVLAFGEDDGSIEAVQTVSGVESPSYLCVAPDGRTLHAGWEVLDWPEGLVSSYAIDPADGTLTYLGVQGSGGHLTSHLSMDSRARWLVLANYWNGRVALFPVAVDGALRERTATVQLTESGADPERQAGPHAHCAIAAPGDRSVYTADLGTDEIAVWLVDESAGSLSEIQVVRVSPGSGPRHLALHPDGSMLYATCELSAEVAVLRRTPDDDRLELVDQRPAVPAGFDGISHAADIQVHPSGRWVYASIRGHDSVATFAVEADGTLGDATHDPSGGRTPRSIAVSPDGRFLVVANQDSDALLVRRIDMSSGRPQETVAEFATPTPACVKFGPSSRSN